MAGTKSVKSNERALQLRQEGNELFRAKSSEAAATKYYESICWAEFGSEEIGLAYGNISAAYHEMKEYEFALAYISLAKRHNYPERLIPKLEARERSCHQHIRLREGEPTCSNLYPKLNVNVAVNPRIPHIARDIHAEEDPSCGIVVIADRDFKVGDVILNEKPLLGSVNPLNQYIYCDYCFGCLGQGMIPCPNCVSTAYCNEQCLEKSWNTFHRFECDIRQELVETARKTGFSYTGVRIFLYGLGLFNDDVDKMMEFRKANPRTGSNPMKLDFVNYDPMEEFKSISKYYRTWKSAFPIEQIAWQFYKVYRRNLKIQSLFKDKVKQSFMLQSFVDYFKAHPNLYGKTAAAVFYTIASTFNKTAYEDSNLARVGTDGNPFSRFVVHRAIKKGDRLAFQQHMEPSSYGCTCGGHQCLDNIPERDVDIVLKVMDDPNIDHAAKTNAHQQFIQAHSYMFTRCILKSMVKTYHIWLQVLFMNMDRDEMRAKAIQTWKTN